MQRTLGSGSRPAKRRHTLSIGRRYRLALPLESADGRPWISYRARVSWLNTFSHCPVRLTHNEETYIGFAQSSAQVPVAVQVALYMSKALFSLMGMTRTSLNE